MLRLVATIAAIAVGATAVCAQNLTAIKQRRDAMQAVGTAGVINFKMMKGETPFDLAKVQAGLQTYQDEVAKFKGLFPADSKTGDDTDASPNIWKKRAEFEAAIDKFITGTKAAAATIKDEASFKTVYPQVVKSCNNCHNEDLFSPKLSLSIKKLKQ